MSHIDKKMDGPFRKALGFIFRKYVQRKLRGTLSLETAENARADAILLSILTHVVIEMTHKPTSPAPKQ